jgi:GMP synthase-like glutamine amidotransferase
VSGSRTDGFRALVVEHERASPGGRVFDWLEAHGAEVDELKLDVESADVGVEEYSLLVSLGSEFAPYDDHIAWIPRGVDLLRRAHENGTSVLGICFGGQLLARALGGKVHRAAEPEIGWLPVRSGDAALVPDGPWFQWHFDTFEIPPGAQLLAESDVGPQAYIVGRSMGVQFHPEVTPGIMEDWVRVYRHELDEEGVDPDGLLEETYSRDESSWVASRALLDRFLHRVARLGEAV